jgi:glycosyltransferase involved in cell wall biosynthesis
MSPLKIFEYMSQNRPIVVSDLPVLREVLDEKKAVLVDPEDPAEWVRGIDGLRDASLRQRLAGAAYREFLEHYTWKGRARGILEILGIDPRYGQ